MSSLRRALERRRGSASCSARARSERGFTALELITVLAILSVVFTIVTSLFISFNQQATNTQDSVVAVRQETQAQQTLIQYLRGASQVLAVYDQSGTQIGPSATELDAITSEGFSMSGPNAYSSNCTNLDALWFRPVGAVHADAQFDITFDVPATGPAAGTKPWSSITPAIDVPSAFTPASSCTPLAPTPRTVATYFALSSQTSPVFTYYTYVGTTLTPLSIQNPVPACAINEIAAIGIHVTFLAGPQIPTEGYAADEPTTLDTIVYLRGSSTAATSTTTTTSTLVACPE
ncbi:MAG: type II secretion system protein [Acidimicrobiales bacterium]|jgi:prepilin-type N-terminal cleavage/methylation domain-containing protein